MASLQWQVLFKVLYKVQFQVGMYRAAKADEYLLSSVQARKALHSAASLWDSCDMWP